MLVFDVDSLNRVFDTKEQSISIFDESLEIRAPEGLESIALGNTPADRLAKHSCPFGGCYEIDHASPRKTLKY